MLDRLIKQGIKYLFVSNSDNLGATLDLDLLAYFAESKKGFVMEVAERTSADKKGGHLAKRKSDGRLLLRESAMCLDEDKADFENVTKYGYDENQPFSCCCCLECKAGCIDLHWRNSSPWCSDLHGYV